MTQESTTIPPGKGLNEDPENPETQVQKGPVNYSFERKKQYNFLLWVRLLFAVERWDESNDLNLFKRKIKLPKDAPDEVQELIKKYAESSLKNIFYYRKKLVAENFWRYSYSVFTFLIVLTVPIFIFYYTDNAISSGSKVDGLEAVGVVLTAMLTSLLGMHQLVSSWAGKRKFRSLFHQAKMDLMQVHFDLEGQAASSYINAHGYDYSGLVDDLKAATKTCKEIVNSETRQYFELSGTPVVDLGSIFSTSMSTASSLVGTFTSKKYTSRLETLKEEEKEKKEKLGKSRDSLQQKNIALKTAYRKVARLEKRTQEIDDQMDQLEDKGLENLSPQEQNKYDKLESRFDALDDERDELADEIETLLSEIENLEIAIEEYQK